MDLEWWYFNGHLTTENGQEFSYHFVTFQSVLPSGLTPRLEQLSWADHANGLHLTEEKPDVSLLEPLSGEFDLPIAGWRMSGNGDLYHLNFGTGDYTVEFEAVSQKPAVLHHGAGLVDLGTAGKTYYYSRTRLETSGTVSVSGVSHPVAGVSWMDHQWGDFTTRDIGWDWLSLNLDDGSDLMVSVVWEQAGHKPVSAYGTYIPANSDPVHLPGNDISLDSTGTWTSSVTGAVYPMNWKLRVDSLELDLTIDSLDGGSRICPERFHPNGLLGGVSRGDGDQERCACSGPRIRGNGGVRPRSARDSANPVSPTLTARPRVVAGTWDGRAARTCLTFADSPTGVERHKLSRWALFPSPPYRASTRLGAPTASGWALTITLTGKATSSLAEPAGTASGSRVAKDDRNAVLDGPGKREGPSRSPDSFALKDISPGRWTSGPTWPTRRLRGPMGLEARPRWPACRTLACGPPALRAQGLHRSG